MPDITFDSPMDARLIGDEELFGSQVMGYQVELDHRSTPAGSMLRIMRSFDFPRKVKP